MRRVNFEKVVSRKEKGYIKSAERRERDVQSIKGAANPSERLGPGEGEGVGDGGRVAGG